MQSFVSSFCDSMLHLWDSSISSSVWLCMNIQTFCHCCSIAKLCPSLWDPMDLQHARLPCPSLSPGVCSNSGPLNWWCHPTISSSVIPFSSCLQSFPASRSFSNIYIYIMLLIGILVVSCYELQCHELLYIGVLVYTWRHFCWVHKQVARIAGL